MSLNPIIALAAVIKSCSDAKTRVKGLGFMVLGFSVYGFGVYGFGVYGFGVYGFGV